MGRCAHFTLQNALVASVCVGALAFAVLPADAEDNAPKPTTASVPEEQLAGPGIYKDMQLLACVYYRLGPECKQRGVVGQFLSGVEANMTPDQIAEAQRMAREWLEQHATDGQQ